MIRKLVPLLLLLIGSGAGVGAGIYLRPATDPAPEMAKEEHPDEDTKVASEKSGDTDKAVEYVKLNNQFVVPVVKNRQVISLVVLALSLEVPEGVKESVFKKEPKLRDSILQVLFDHANVGGFDGAFTEADRLTPLRAALREVCQRDLGADQVNDVLILEIARQDY